MVFSSSIPIYLDPSNWQQERLNQQSGGENSQLPPPPPGGGGGGGSIRPGSMADRARLANIPQPQAALKCPRCDSTNTKFCYFNNYNLSQPRHFCKTCRRYWTRGGALRSVPVGGGCRRNKKRKGSGRSKSPVASGSSSTGAVLPSNGCSSTVLGDMPPPPTQLPLLPPLSQLSEYNSRDIIGLNLGGIQEAVAGTGGAGDMEFQIGSSNSSGASASINRSGIVEQWRLQQVHHQFPNFLGNLEETTTNGLYPFDQGSREGYVAQLRLKPLDSVVAPLMGSVEMEENHHHRGLNLSRNILGVNNPGNQDHHHYWGTATTSNSWNDLHSAFI